MIRFLIAAVALTLIAVAAYACDFAGLPPDLVELAGLGAVALVLALGSFAIGRWSRG